MQPIGPYVGVEVAYRHEQIAKDFEHGGHRRHHPVRRIGRAISHVHQRLDGV